MTCEECGAAADEAAEGWEAYRGDEMVAGRRSSLRAERNDTQPSRRRSGDLYFRRRRSMIRRTMAGPRTLLQVAVRRLLLAGASAAAFALTAPAAADTPFTYTPASPANGTTISYNDWMAAGRYVT